MNIFKRFYRSFYRNYSTKGLIKYWLKPQKDSAYWQAYLKTWNIPRRQFVTKVLSGIPFISLYEIGCGSGPNLVSLIKRMPGKQIGGCDINPIAIQLAKVSFKNGVFHCCSADDIFSSDKGIDIVLSDMCLIYVGPFKIKKYLQEIKRVARNWVVLVEYHHESWWQRQKLRISSGRHAYNYRTLLDKLGFYDIGIVKMPKFEEDNDDSYRHIVIARVPKR